MDIEWIVAIVMEHKKDINHKQEIDKFCSKLLSSHIFKIALKSFYFVTKLFCYEIIIIIQKWNVEIGYKYMDDLWLLKQYIKHWNGKICKVVWIKAWADQEW